MANHGMAAAEAALRARKLDRTLTTALPPLGRMDVAVAATAIDPLDGCLRGGLPRGHLSEIAGPRSAGRTTLLLQLLAAATRRGEIAAVVDTCDCLDVASVVSAGVELDRLLWIRGSPTPSALADRAIERALKALNLVLQAGGFGVVAIDLADAPLTALNRIPFTTWLRSQRTIEASETACVLMGPCPLARSAGGLTLSVTGRPRWDGAADRSRRLTGTDVAVRVISPRRRIDGDVAITAASADGPRRHRDTENIYSGSVSPRTGSYRRPGPLGPGSPGGSDQPPLKLRRSAVVSTKAERTRPTQ
jgi:recombination protein RecA